MPSPEGEPQEEGRLVETGSFRIDSEKAREKFAKFAFADPLEFALAWARLLATSNPKTVRIFLDGDASVLSYNGDPLPLAARDDPFGGLETGREEERMRLFSLGYVSALALAPVRIEARSATDSPEHQIRIVWAAQDAAHRHRDFSARLNEALRLLPASVEVDGADRPRIGETPNVESGVAAGHPIFIEEVAQSERGRVLVYKQGTLAHTRELQGVMGLQAHIVDDAVPLDLTGCRAAIGPRLQGVVDSATGSLMDRLNKRKLPVEREASRKTLDAHAAGWPFPDLPSSSSKPPALKFHEWAAVVGIAVGFWWYVYSWTPPPAEPAPKPPARGLVAPGTAGPQD